MANGNPFYINPSLDITQGLQGLGASLAYARDKKEKEDIKKGAVEVYKSGDPEAIAEYAIRHPEINKELTSAVKFRDQETKNNYINSAFRLLQTDNPEEVAKITKSRQAFLKAKGLQPDERMETDSFLERYKADPEGTKKKIEQEIAFLAPEKYKAYREALTGTTKAPAKVLEFEYYQDLKKTNPDVADQFALGAGFAEGDNETAAAKNFNKYINLLNTNPKQAKLFGDQIGIKRNTPLTDIAKLKTDMDNGLISREDYDKQRDKILNPTMKTKAELARAALKGDPEAKAILKMMLDDAIAETEGKSYATTKGKLKGLFEAMDGEGTARAIIAGRETLDNVKNTFGVPIQEMVRKRVLELEPDFNFVQPRAIEKSLSSSLVQQQKNRGSVGSFAQNINGQVDKVEKIMNSVIKRFGVRALDVPWRNLKTLAIGAGDERVLESFMKEISVEIFKLSQGSTASVALLPEEGRIEWEKIHDVNLSWPELKKVLLGTKDMANIRVKSFNDEIKATIENLSNIRSSENLYMGGPDSPGAEFPNTITVTNPETGEEEVWDTTTETRVK